MYQNLTLLDGENDGDGTTVEIVRHMTLGYKSIPKFTLFSKTEKPPVFETETSILEYYKTHKFIYEKNNDVRSQPVLLGNKID